MQKPEITFHNPNTDEQTREILIQIIAELMQEKAKESIYLYSVKSHDKI